MAGYKINTIPVHFDKGTSGTTITNALSGADVKDYTLVAKAGQLMHVTLKSKWPHPYFNVINPANETIFNGSMTEGAFEQRRQPTENIPSACIRWAARAMKENQCL